MRNSKLFAIILTVLLICLTAGLQARSNYLQKDGNGNVIQQFRSFATAADTVVTVGDSIAVPANTAEVTIIAKDQIVYLNSGLINQANTYWIQIPAGLPGITLPVMGNTYIRYKALTGTAKLYFVWKKL